MSVKERPVVLSVEQALSMPYATLRLVHLGWRVIRVEPTPIKGRKTKGDPNRYIGRPVAGEDRHSYYVAPNVGKEAIALNLKTEQGRELLHNLIDKLEVDVFCTNTMPARHGALGIDYHTLKAVKEDLLWCGISAMGTQHPNVPGYDPAMQALCGYMDLTGFRDGPPLQCGPPIIDLKAGDEAFAQILLAMWERDRTKAGKMIDISMAHGAVSWLQTFLPMLDMGSPPSEIRRNGNEHRQFIPVNAYPTKDGFIYIALGSDVQWGKLVATEMFQSLNEERYATNEGRRQNKEDLHSAIGAITKEHNAAAVEVDLQKAGVPYSPISSIEQVWDLDFVQETQLKTVSPEGETIRLPPPAAPSTFLDDQEKTLPFPPRYGENTDALLAEAGTPASEIVALREALVIA